MALWRRPRRLAWAVVGLESLPVAFLSLYFLQISYLPDSNLQVGPGEPFPAYALLDQDEVAHARSAGEPRPPALYIFYRGDW